MKEENAAWWTGWIQMVWAHPYAALALVCLAAALLTDQTAGSLLTPEGIMLGGIVAAVGAMASWRRAGRSLESRLKVAAGAVGAALVLTLAVLLGRSANAAAWFTLAALMILAAIALCLAVQRRLTWRWAVCLLLAAGFALRLGYVLYTDIYTRQHDVAWMGAGTGHMGYIEYFVQYRRLPDFDPRSHWQFYHPPLYHILSAAVYSFFGWIGMEPARIGESLQFVTLFYSSACMVLAYRIFRQMGLARWGLLTALALICFYPMFIQLAGGLNNDILSITFMLAAVLYTLRWHKERTLRHILCAALFMGLGMMTKLSAALLAPAMAWVFLAGLIRAPASQRRRIWLEFAAFFALCAPLGLWWPLRNLALFDMPLNYVAEIGRDSGQYIGHIDAVKRLFDFSAYQFRQLYEAWGQPYQEFNMFVGLLKTGVFDEQTFTDIQPLIYGPSRVLFSASIALVPAALLAALRRLLRRDTGMDAALRGFWILLPVTLLLSYIQLNLRYPQTCTANMRYVMLLVVVAGYFLGSLWQGPLRKKGVGRLACAVAGGLVALFCLSSAVVYVMLGIAA